MIKDTWDVIVIGAGPAGSTTAALLAERGYSVLILEKEKFPRYHVGESLMPFCWYTLDRLGLVSRMDEIGFQKKYSVQFASQEGNVSSPFYFFEHRDHPSSITWQVERSAFDQMILEKAVNNGATFLDEAKALSTIYDENRARITGLVVKVKGILRSFNCRQLVDASGRDCFYSSKSKWRQRDPNLSKVAIWTYYKGGKRNCGIDEGSTTIAALPNKGWFWHIPQQGDRVSLGIVAERDYLFSSAQDPKEIIEREIENNSWVRDSLATAEQIDQTWVTGDYSYRATHCATRGLVLVGDAFAFLDPVFSSGVFLALKSAELAADSIYSYFKSPKSERDCFTEYGKSLCDAIERMRKIVSAFYHPTFNFADLIKENPKLKGTLTDLLIGDVFDDKYSEMFSAMEALFPIPKELPYGYTIK